MNFFNNFKQKDFFKGFIRKPLYTIVVVYNDGKTYEKGAIEDPWAYMKEVKKDPKVKTTYIKDEF
jgi:hypothetical protein